MRNPNLSAREEEILGLLADSLTYKQIAARLALSTSTVRTHLHTIYGKLGVHDRAQAVLAFSTGRHDGFAISEDRRLYQAIRGELTEIAAHLRTGRRDKLTSRQHAYLDAFTRSLTAPLRSDHEQALDDAATAFREILGEAGVEILSDKRRRRTRRAITTAPLARKAA